MDDLNPVVAFSSAAASLAPTDMAVVVATIQAAVVASLQHAAAAETEQPTGASGTTTDNPDLVVSVEAAQAAL
jgi:hypothetical protein